jgi:hypothetical protein
VALVDLTVCAVCLLNSEDPDQIFIAELSISSPVLNEGEYLTEGRMFFSQL